MNPLRWELRSNGADYYWVEAITEKWKYQVQPDLSFDDRWVTHREFADTGLNGTLLGELWVDTFRSFDEALDATERWHTERDSDFDLERVDR